MLVDEQTDDPGQRNLHLAGVRLLAGDPFEQAFLALRMDKISVNGAAGIVPPAPKVACATPYHDLSKKTYRCQQGYPHRTGS